MTATSIQLSDSARERMRSYLAGEPKAVAVRLAVRKTGCSGYGYHVELATESAADDEAFELDGVPVLVDAKSLPLIKGTHIDFQRQGLNANFVFSNPNATGECGCGESFTVGS